MALQHRESNQLEAGEDVADFEGGGCGGVRAMSAIVADAGAEVAADGAGGGFLGIGGAHGVAPLEDGAFGFEDQGEDFAGAHEGGEFAEEGTLAMHGVEAAGFFFGEAHGFYGDNLETRFVNAGKNLALLTATDGVRFDDCESAFESQERILQIKVRVKFPPSSRRHNYCKAAARVAPRSAGDSTVRMPAAAIAAYLAFAVPWPPVMRAPARPRRRAGGAVCPPMKPTTGFFTLALIRSAARSSALPPISPIIMMACVSGSLLKNWMASRNVVPMMGSPPMPMPVDWPVPSCVNWWSAS